MMQDNTSPRNITHRNKIKSCLEIMNDYLHEELRYEEAKSKLTVKNSSTSDFLIGELTVEECFRLGTTRWSLISSHLEQAKASYKKVIRNVHQENPETNASNKLRSGLRLAQIPSLNSILKSDQIPNLSTFTSMYSKIVNLGATTLAAYPDVFVDQHDTTLEVKGTLGEIALLALAQRHSLREVNGEGWLPLQSFFSQDHGGDCQENTEGHAWDMTIFTQYDPDCPLESTYKIQDKIFFDGQNRVNNDITTIGVRPDLQIRQNEYSSTIIKSILLGCQIEYNAVEPRKAERITSELDFRTNKLLSILD